MKARTRWLLLTALTLFLVALARLASTPAPADGGPGAGPVRHLDPPGVPASSTTARSEPVLPVTGIHDAVETTEGWVVLDAAASRLLWLDRAGRPLRAAGAKGQGPGEMMNPTALAVLGDTLMVLETLGGPAHLFDGQGRFLERLPGPVGACATGSVLDVAARPGAVFVLRTCSGSGGLLRAHLERWQPGGLTRAVHDAVLEDLRETLSPFRRPSAAVLPSAVAYAVAHDACALLLTASGARETVCYPDERRPPLPPPAAERARVVLGQRTRAAGVELVVPERWPPFDAVDAAGSRLAFFVRPRPGVLALDIVTDAGGLQRLEVEGADRLFTGARSLLAVRETLVGPAVSVVPLP